MLDDYAWVMPMYLLTDMTKEGSNIEWRKIVFCCFHSDNFECWELLCVLDNAKLKYRIHFKSLYGFIFGICK